MTDKTTVVICVKEFVIFLCELNNSNYKDKGNGEVLNIALLT